MHRLLIACGLLAFAAGAAGQEPKLAFAPPAPGIVVTKDVEYGTSGDVTLRMDVYRPPDAGGRKLPALIFFNRATGADRSETFYAAWARAAASNGLVAILPDLRDRSEAADFQVLARHLAARAGDLGIDAEAIAVYAASGNVSAALPALQDPAQTVIKAAVIYYGTAPVARFRLDLPILFVRAGLDRPSLNRGMGELAARAVTQNAPVTVLNHSTGHHGFEAVDPDAATRLVIQETLGFVKTAVSQAYQAALRQSLLEATAAGHVVEGNFGDAAAVYARMLTSRPDDARLRLAFGEALLGDKRYAEACAELDKLKGKGLGYRDLGLPAARACLLKGDPAAAVAWLATIPARYLPPSVADDPSFAALKEREDFKALFKR